MPYSDGIVSPPVSIYDVQRALGTSEIDIGRIIANGSINMWAKFKPVALARISTIEDLVAGTTRWKPDSAFTLGNEPWWKVGGLYGLDITLASVSVRTTLGGTIAALDTIAQRVARRTDSANYWTYNRPTGGSTQPYRLLDFSQYNVNAPRPVSGVIGPKKVVSAINTPWSYSINVREVQPGSIDDRDYIVPKDLVADTVDVPDMILGFAIYYKDTAGDYHSIAWATGSIWNGLGIANSDSTAPDVISGEKYCIAQFKSGHKYYALPVYFTKDATQPSTANASKNVGGGKIFTVPFTDFLPFDAEQRSSIGIIATVTIGNRTIGTDGTFAMQVVLDATDTAMYQGGTFDALIIGLVNETWDGNWTSVSSGMYRIWRDNFTTAQRTVARGGTTTPFNQLVDNIDLAHTWMVVVKADQDEYYFQLRQPVNP